MDLLRRHLWTAWLVLLLAASGVAFLAGARQEPFENRALVSPPSLRLGTIADPQTFARMDSTVRDLLPYRRHAVELTGRIALDMFGESPHPDVAVGDDDWLFSVPELRNCRRNGRLKVDPAEAFALVVGALRASGRTVTTILAESKFSIRRADAPAVDPSAQACTNRFERRLAASIARLPGGVDIGRRLGALETQGQRTFLVNDTHWSWRGRELFIRAVLDGIRPGLAGEVRLGPGFRYERKGDLGVIMGVPRQEMDRTVRAERPPARPVAPGTILLVGDSQMRADLITPVVSSQPSVLDVALPRQRHCDVLALPTCEKAIRASQHIVLQIVARHLPEFLDECWRPIAVAAEQLPSAPAKWERLEGGRWQPLTGSLTLDSGRSRLRTAALGGTARSLLRIPVRRIGRAGWGGSAEVRVERPRTNGRSVACVTPSRSSGRDLLLPVNPKGRLDRVTFTIAGPPGSVVGPIRETALHLPG